MRWWHRGFVYLDTVGITNQHEGLIDVRRFDDRDGKSVLLVDNFRNMTGLSVSFAGKQYAIAGDMISAIETTANEDKIDVDIKLSGEDRKTATAATA